MSDDQDRPKLTVVAENSRKQIDANLLQEQLDYALLVLAANVIRVVRGAGKPDDIIFQCNDVVKAAVEYKDKVGRFVSSHSVAGALRLPRERVDDYDSFHGQRQLAMREMMDGSLQVVASRLLGQLTQEHRGEREMFEAFRDLERIYQDLRKQREAEAKAARTRAAPKRKQAKRKKNDPPVL
ncbi:hypothetical protein [Sinorhizobium meliloti]|uniref:Uncharacterized protein n=1 Tax=Rhizobium meliloti TaxID=382 RepID=A0A2J0Z8D9_RHIML|nr:hypothetical protein [Sinorhizobium meliloti]PJR16786.1 hypothetical protein CEJ86_00820 [Sinorhizobium meliloti]